MNLNAQQVYALPEIRRRRHYELEPLFPIVHANNWRGHPTSPTEVSLKGRLPQKLQSNSTLSCEIVQIHSLFRHGFIKKPKSKFNRNSKYTYMFCSYVTDFQKQILVII